MIYTPDRWVVLKIEIDSDVHQRVLAGWYGGYLNGDYWKLSSGTIETVDNGEYWTMPQYSGSVYNCRKASYGFSTLTASVLNQLCEQEGVRITVVEEYAPA